MVRKYLTWLIVPIIAVGIFFALDYYNNLNAPKLLVDTDVQIDYGGVLLNPPVEITGKDPSHGKLTNVCGKVPEEWAGYVRYNDSWNSNPFNPDSQVGKSVMAGVYIILGVVVLALIVRVVYLYKKGKLRKLKLGEK